MGKKRLEEMASIMDGLGHPLRLRIIAILAMNGSLYLSDIAKRLGVSRALAKVHLVKLQKAGLVRSSVRLMDGEAKALRYYELVDFNITVNPRIIVELAGGGDEQ
ncbi:ArsR/SmtB family transcription factor [Caldivirga maquilingensis]|uniref:Regulatory protein ArsR n=1 Tax=Caldivirga maquilingensis (strain ATCC 700844 / DSM 13496 / JCM 10307 / IC-167) TaxID=397948 RepID=A8M993_CALMQ|nr:helix-turn-helix domain-containing protein [Caldivirga maquilingensis]ABW02312.1 regulatory protein ArsR [Caldivirga maquilingensis IC-167]